MNDPKSSFPPAPTHFIRQIIEKDLAEGKHTNIVTRFPPEPNGYLHVGHAKSICLNFGLAEDFNGQCNLRFDDTNPEKESQEYIDAIREDVQWLGYQWCGAVRYASDYFPQLYQYAIELIQAGKAYVCSLSPEEIRDFRGTLTQPGKESPYRNRTVAENLDLFERMCKGEFKEGEHVLRAKIDMASPNMNLRDPALYRIRHVEHHQTKAQWCVYPMYDYTHCLSDALEGITHSLCTLEFEDHRSLYDWVLDNVSAPCHPRQIEFARLNLNYTITSKRKLKQLVDEDLVQGWDDPRMPTISGLRRRGYTANAIRNFCQAIGVAKADSVVDMGMLEYAIRDDLDKTAPRAMCVLNPLKVVITNYPADREEILKAPVHPKEDMGERVLPFNREIWIDRNDFMENPPGKYFRLAPGKEVRLRCAYIIKCEEVVKDQNGNITELRCSFDPDTLGKNPQGRKVKGVIHWVSQKHAVPCEVRLYDRLFTEPDPESGENYLDFMNPNSLQVLMHCWAEPGLQKALPESKYQFEREGYFCADRRDSTATHLVFNRIVALRDSWSKQV